jgi:hypothetical protein
MPVEDRPLRLGTLLGASVRAVLQAQVQAELTTLEFVDEVGLGGERRVATLDFELVQPVPDPRHPGQVTPTPTKVSVPLLSILQTPAIRIAEATVGLAVEVTDVIEDDTSSEPGRPSRAELVGIVAPREGRAGRPALTIDMKLARARPSESYQRIIRLLGDSISAVTHVEDQPEAPK